jgi:hypothetical protein
VEEVLVTVMKTESVQLLVGLVVAQVLVRLYLQEETLLLGILELVSQEVPLAQLTET